MNKLITLTAALACAAAPAHAAGNTVTIKGSDTMVILGQRWAESYMNSHKGAVIQVTGGGSGVGIAALINGGTDIAEASRPMKDEEKAQAKAKRGKDVVETAVALDGLAIYVNASNPLNEITLEQAKAIYTGKAKSWKELGGKDAEIIAYSRENNSGTYAYFKEHVLKNEDFMPEALNMPGTAAVINAVSKDKNAIGYGGIAYAKGIKGLKVKKDAASPAVEASMANVVSGKYPISRALFFYTAGAPEGPSKDFVAFALSPEGQKICEQVGYYPIAAKKGGKASAKPSKAAAKN
jgi:phosphate transport system substrate-binding protein